jgi:hypothetical protein
MADDSDGELEQPMEEVGMLGKKRRVGGRDQWIESSARAEAGGLSLGVGNTKNWEGDDEVNGVGNGVKRARKDQKSDGHSLKRVKMVHGRT